MKEIIKYKFNYNGRILYGFAEQMEQREDGTYFWNIVLRENGKIISDCRTDFPNDVSVDEVTETMEILATSLR